MGKPRLIIIVRHAQSEGNRDKTIHQTTPDHRVGLTPEGHQQAREAGEKLRELLRNDDTLHFFISPYRRTRETTEGILNGLTSNNPVPSPFQRSHIKVYEEPRLREQDFGNFQPGTAEVERLWRERADYGHFFYRIPNGESGADVYDRITSFNGSLWRRFSEDDMASVAILVTHGLCSRVFLMAWYHYGVEFFEDLRNINHCEFLVMKLNSNGRYVLQNQLRRWTDLKRERAAARKSISSSTPVVVEQIPVRRWTSNKSATESSNFPRPARKNTVDMFRDESDVVEEGSAKGRSSPISIDRRGPAPTSSRELSRTLVGSSSHLRKISYAASAEKQHPKAQRTKFYLGRDGGGTRSGQGSPFGSDEEGESPSTTPEQKNVGGSSESLKHISSSLARALRGDFDDPDRKMADALGDQSDAEVDEADLELGTKEKEEQEQQSIVDEERRERSHQGSVY